MWQVYVYIDIAIDDIDIDDLDYIDRHRYISINIHTALCMSQNMVFLNVTVHMSYNLYIVSYTLDCTTKQH